LKLEIPARILRQILEQAGTEAPIEACGILAGSNGKARKLYAMTNADKSRTHFMMEPKEQFEVVKDIRSNGLEMLAIYHSHPATPARPSQEDIRLSFTPGVTYVIVSLQDSNGAVVKGFNIEDGNVTEVPVEITEH
jgi:proteasome lid subunit RPN8/RPN11